MMYFEIAYFTILFIIVCIIRKRESIQVFECKNCDCVCRNPLEADFCTRCYKLVVHIDMDKVICYTLFFTIATYLIHKSSKPTHHCGICNTYHQYCKLNSCALCRNHNALLYMGLINRKQNV